MFHFLIFLSVVYIIECLFLLEMHLVHDCFMSTIGSLHLTAAVSSLILILIPTAYYFHMETQNPTCYKRNYTLLYFYISGELITLEAEGKGSRRKREWPDSYFLPISFYFPYCSAQFRILSTFLLMEYSRSIPFIQTWIVF